MTNEERAMELYNALKKCCFNVDIIKRIAAHDEEIRRECENVKMEKLVAIYEAGYDMGKYVVESAGPNKRVIKLPLSREDSIRAAIMDKD